MFAKFAPFAAAALVLALGARADLSISTPSSVAQCGKVTFQVGGVPDGQKYALFVVNPSNPCGDAITEKYDITGSSFDWVANVAAGTAIQFEIEDNDGNAGWSGAVTVQPGDSSCLTSSSSAAPSSTASSSVTRTTARVSAAGAGSSDVPVNAGDDTSGALPRSVSAVAGLAVAAAAAFLAL